MVSHSCCMVSVCRPNIRNVIVQFAHVREHRVRHKHERRQRSRCVQTGSNSGEIEHSDRTNEPLPFAHTESPAENTNPNEVGRVVTPHTHSTHAPTNGHRCASQTRSTRMTVNGTHGVWFLGWLGQVFYGCICINAG